MPLPKPFIRLLYNLLLTVLTPFVLCRLLLKSRRNPEYRRHIAERFGRHLPLLTANNRPLWVHAVSVGEFIAVRALLIHLLRQRPDLHLWLTCTTPTARRQIAAFCADHPGRVTYSYLPYDTPGNNNRALQHIRPTAIILMETEIWPNLIRQANKHHIPVLLINARLSARSLRRYVRFARCFISPVLALLHINAQTRFDARRFHRLGAPRSNITVTPNLKYQTPVFQPVPADILALQKPAYTWLAASTHQGEEEIILAAHRKLQQTDPAARLIIAPRHPERRRDLSTYIKKAGYTPCLRSSGHAPETPGEILILDTLGELTRFCGIVNTVFIGGTLIPRGGHNPLEPLHSGKPIIFGTSMYNFQSIRDELSTCPFARQLSDNTPENLCAALLDFRQADYHDAITAYTALYTDIVSRHAAFIEPFLDLKPKNP